MESRTGSLAVADLVLDRHAHRRRNPGEGDWLMESAGLVVVYNWPDRGDRTSALVITVWRE
jgi:hypothetical protein